MNSLNPLLSRRRALQGITTLAGLGLAGSVLTSCAGSTTGPDGLRRVRLTQAVNSLAYAQNYIAQRAGYFRDVGLAVETVVTDGGGPDVQAVLAGSAGFTINDGGQVITALSGNRRLTAVAATFDRCLVNATISVRTAQRLGIDATTPLPRKLAVLPELRIGVTAPGALTWQIARFNLVGAGADPDSATLVALGGGPAVLAALESDQVDVIYISVPFGEQAVQRGTGLTLIDHSAGEDPTLSRFMMEGLWVRPGDIEEDRESIVGMVTALQRASTFIRTASPEEIADVLQPDFTAFGREVLLAAVERLKGAVPADGRWDATAQATTERVLRTNGLLRPDAPPLASIVEDRFLT
ncbi:ABC-type nitrate/sulfonate/bicarbonate transport system, substrate-binding protein [Pseudonocardia thermophila]|uniref:ABC-type nitrate/sulfonate/bicarbonate transport system, substrate-binding protein n=1 Tax=Pseudonocardia thermophila TaxID=1848 RepID=A0A1M6TRN2_PSETH|nr:ABC-type nitrate/sulfonate/bicarbonate transport system, substrate-binding protein [Pseudonocardia thermophila]